MFLGGGGGHLEGHCMGWMAHIFFFDVFYPIAGSRSVP